MVFGWLFNNETGNHTLKYNGLFFPHHALRTGQLFAPVLSQESDVQ